MSAWTDLTVRVRASDAETVAAIAQMCDPGGIYLEDYSDFETEIRKFGPIEIIDEALLARAADKEYALVHLYISPEDDPQETVAFMEERMRASGISFTVQTAEVHEEDWANNWKQYFKPLPVGEKLVIVPTWDPDVPAEYADRTRLTIDPGMAFGSGQHETTRLCLEMLERCVCPKSHILDVGTGSGILAIGALLLGAEEAVGVDIDALAVKISAENAALNGAGDRFRAVCGDLAGGVRGRFDVICANIVADVILRLLPDVGAHLQPGGDFVVSGIITEREQDVLDGLRAYGFRAVETRRDRGWCCIRARAV